jgi:hypothetical protein
MDWNFFSSPIEPARLIAGGAGRNYSKSIGDCFVFSGVFLLKIRSAAERAAFRGKVEMGSFSFPAASSESLLLPVIQPHV